MSRKRCLPHHLTQTIAFCSKRLLNYYDKFLSRQFNKPIFASAHDIEQKTFRPTVETFRLPTQKTSDVLPALLTSSSKQNFKAKTTLKAVLNTGQNPSSKPFSSSNTELFSSSISFEQAFHLPFPTHSSFRSIVQHISLRAFGIRSWSLIS